MKTRDRTRANIRASGRRNTGKMHDSIRVVQTGDAKYSVGSDLPYYKFQEFGRGPVRPIRAKFLRFKPKGSNKFVFAKYVRPDPGGHFLRDARRALSLRDFGI